MNECMTKLGDGGRIVLPAAFRKALAVAPGESLVLVLEGETVRIMSRAAAVRHAQALVRQYIPEGTRLSEELLADRRAEVERG